jgi:hypothetical protein
VVVVVADSLVAVVVLVDTEQAPVLQAVAHLLRPHYLLQLVRHIP